MEEIQRFRDLEQHSIADVANSNNIVEIRKKMEDDDANRDLRMACTHCLRRIFINYIERKLVFPPLSDSKRKTSEGKVAAWMWKQYKLFRQMLCTFLASDEDWSWELSIKTLLELTKKETEYFAQRSRLLTNTFAEVYTALLITRKQELDADLLLVFRSEVFAYPDCVFHSLRVLFDYITELKVLAKKDGLNNGSDNMSVSIQNAIDLLRMIDIPDEVSTEEFYIPLGLGQTEGDEDNEDDSDHDDDDDDSSVEDRKAITADAKRSKGKRNASLLGKRNSEDNHNTSNKRRRVQDIISLTAYQKLFSKVWIHALSLPMNLSMHKTLLKHIADHVLIRLHNPLLLADYLTQCYNLGGIVAVLALESLFTLILQHNLDYPRFFESLYSLCTVRIFNAKYGMKFMKLLHQSLRSTNIPAYLVAAFIKRLAGLALQVSAPRVSFCIAQIAWLLRAHRASQVLVHRKSKKDAAATDDDAAVEEKDYANSNSNLVATVPSTGFVLEQDDNLEHGGALQSSLWELEALENHYLYDVAQLATSLRDPMSTSVGNVPIVVEQYIDEGISTYQELIDADLNRRPKRNAAMAFRPPTALFVGQTSHASADANINKHLTAPPTTYAGKLQAQQEQAALSSQEQRVMARLFDW